MTSRRQAIAKNKSLKLPRPNPIESDTAHLKFEHTAVNKDLHLFISGVHEPKLCPECIQPGSTKAESDTSELPDLDNLYQPQITDLELNEHQGNERPVIYLDDAKATVQSLIDEARLKELDNLIDIESKQFMRWSQKDIANFFDVVGKRYRELEARLKSKGEQPEEEFDIEDHL